MNLDEMFHKLNNLDETHELFEKGIALSGFITLEKIFKLLPYKDIYKIDKEVTKYFINLEKTLEEVE